MPANRTGNQTTNTSTNTSTPSGGTSNNVINTGNDQLDLELIEREIQGTMISILANLSLLASANKNRQLILDRQNGIKSSNPLEATQLAALSSLLTLCSATILSEIAEIRLVEREQNIESGTAKGTITPNINITFGYKVVISGLVFRAIGALQRLQEEDQITIL
ncbi:hypothetical protein [Clostridium sp. 'White wine YQ']|uniref:hypothetical protein n=1 Tax=Clostridium sp. 'White wine YQ' TaxID=3027474 RepID=UPI00236659F1|nr:hypothetical protein [Clostridium sp. 'White wine YQ']MDD7793147.1 hypothetical protein [Clostridium sp. 'White wine YQ']